jgi:hypothetical protein
VRQVCSASRCRPHPSIGIEFYRVATYQRWRFRKRGTPSFRGRAVFDVVRSERVAPLRLLPPPRQNPYKEQISLINPEKLQITTSLFFKPYCTTVLLAILSLSLRWPIKGYVSRYTSLLPPLETPKCRRNATCFNQVLQSFDEAGTSPSRQDYAVTGT